MPKANLSTKANTLKEVLEGFEEFGVKGMRLSGSQVDHLKTHITHAFNAGRQSIIDEYKAEQAKLKGEEIK